MKPQFSCFSSESSRKKDATKKKVTHSRNNATENPLSANTDSYSHYDSYQNSDNVTSAKEAFFDKLQFRNASRPEYVFSAYFIFLFRKIFHYSNFFEFRDVPPSQGGKYSGFGYTMESTENNALKPNPTLLLDNAVSSLTAVSTIHNSWIEKFI